MIILWYCNTSCVLVLEEVTYIVNFSIFYFLGFFPFFGNKLGGVAYVNIQQVAMTKDSCNSGKFAPGMLISPHFTRNNLKLQN